MSKKLQVVKIGHSSIIRNGNVDEETLIQVGYDIIKLKIEESTNSILVVSGAIPLGMLESDIKERPSNSIELQSLARVGQPELIKALKSGLKAGSRRYFDETSLIYMNQDLLVGSQFLVTYHNLDYPDERRNIVFGLYFDISKNRVPLINYNDGVDPTEVRRDNDTLAARIAIYSHADRLVILTDVDGLLNEEGDLVRVVNEITSATKALCRKTGEGIGGMETKLNAAELVMPHGIEMLLGNIKHGIYGLQQPDTPKTIFVPKQNLYKI